jgi:hypothetical protein
LFRVAPTLGQGVDPGGDGGGGGFSLPQFGCRLGPLKRQLANPNGGLRGSVEGVLARGELFAGLPFGVAQVPARIVLTGGGGEDSGWREGD